MPTLNMDHVEGRSRSALDAEGWVTTQRIARVTNVVGLGEAKHQTALALVGMPVVGDRHPRIADMFVTELIPATVDQNVVDVTIQYRRKDVPDNPDYTRWQVGATVIQGDTNKDSSGALLDATYTPDGGGETIEASPTMSKFFPQATASATRREKGWPLGKAVDYVGKMNSSGFLGGAAKTVLCMAITGASDDNGEHFEVTYVFQYRRETWDGEWFYFGPNGLVPADVDVGTGNGYLKAQIYQTANFGSLGL